MLALMCSVQGKHFNMNSKKMKTCNLTKKKRLMHPESKIQEIFLERFANPINKRAKSTSLFIDLQVSRQIVPVS